MIQCINVHYCTYYGRDSKRRGQNPLNDYTHRQEYHKNNSTIIIETFAATIHEKSPVSASLRPCPGSLMASLRHYRRSRKVSFRYTSFAHKRVRLKMYTVHVTVQTQNPRTHFVKTVTVRSKLESTETFEQVSTYYFFFSQLKPVVSGKYLFEHLDLSGGNRFPDVTFNPSV